MQLPEDILDRIVRLLVRPLPKPGTASWADLHQGDLAVLMRVNSAFNLCASRYLYHTVVVNDLRKFVFGMGDGHEQERRISPTKVKLLGRIRRLFIESRWKFVSRTLGDERISSPAVDRSSSTCSADENPIADMMVHRAEDLSTLNQMAACESIQTISFKVLARMPHPANELRHGTWPSIPAVAIDTGVSARLITFLNTVRPSHICENFRPGGLTFTNWIPKAEEIINRSYLTSITLHGDISAYIPPHVRNCHTLYIRPPSTLHSGHTFLRDFDVISRHTSDKSGSPDCQVIVVVPLPESLVHVMACTGMDRDIQCTFLNSRNPCPIVVSMIDNYLLLLGEWHRRLYQGGASGSVRPRRTVKSAFTVGPCCACGKIEDDVILARVMGKEEAEKIRARFEQEELRLEGGRVEMTKDENGDVGMGDS